MSDNKPLTSDCSQLTKIIIQEFDGFDRINEPITVGIPFPKGLIKNTDSLVLTNADGAPIPLQTEVLKTWQDKSLQWVLFDFQVKIRQYQIKELILSCKENEQARTEAQITVEEHNRKIFVDTGAGQFWINKRLFKPFDRVIVKGLDILNDKECLTNLVGENGETYKPVIDFILFEKNAPLSSTLKIEGQFKSADNETLTRFFSRIYFYAGKSTCRIDFTIHNPRAAKHPAGLWDLGDPGSVYFKDLSIRLALNSEPDKTQVGYSLHEDPVPMDYKYLAASQERGTRFIAHSSQVRGNEFKNLLNSNNAIKQAIPQKPIDPNNGEDTTELLEITGNRTLTIYQDSSGGENWRSSNHVNRNNESNTSFCGFRVYSGKKLIKEGLRANPTISVFTKKMNISARIQHFWQNFPKAIKADGAQIIIKLFPEYFSDIYELQGGEQKTNTVHLEFDKDLSLNWTKSPLIARTATKWYTDSKVNPFFMQIDEVQTTNQELNEIIRKAIDGNNTFFHRREIIDEYGWRHFGELYADHESVGNPGGIHLVSHYNNQYDIIYSSLIQFLKTSDQRWHILADQLCRHVRDIDIYHTTEDRPEYNQGLFWHTEHYVDARTATHRCFSRQHGESRDLKVYGGGPSLSHCYSTGFLYHYYLTGDLNSRNCVLELAEYVQNNIRLNRTFSNRLRCLLTYAKSYLKNYKNDPTLVQLEKVYGLNGPGRASGNALSTLLDAFCLTGDSGYLEDAEWLIGKCIHPNDNIEKRELLDVENRWMYTIFLQALGRYIDTKTEYKQFDDRRKYAIHALIKYAEWMLVNECPYLDQSEKLEFPNETWAAQDLRKGQILIKAASFFTSIQKKNVYLKKGRYFYNTAVVMLKRFESRTLTRPLALAMQNAPIYCYSLSTEKDIGVHYEEKLKIKRSLKNKKPVLQYLQIFFLRMENIIKSEIEFIKWRLPK